MIELLLMFAGAALIYFGVQFNFKKKWHVGLSGDIKFSTNTAYPGDEINMYEVITNKNKITLPVVNVKIRLDRRLHFDGEDANASVSDFSYKNDVFCIHGNQRVTRTIPITCMERGVFKVDNMEFICSGAFLDDILHKYQECDSELVVYPALVDASAIDIPFKKIMGDILVNQRIYEDPFEFVGIREYQPFDSFSSVNWKATARTMDLRVNVHGNTISQKLVIGVNVEDEGMLTMNKLLESSISMGTCLAGMMIDNGVTTSIFTNGRDCETGEEIAFEDGSSLSHTDAIRYGFAKLDLTKEKQSFAKLLHSKCSQLSDDNLVVIVSYAAHKEMVEEINKIVSRGINCIWIMPHIIDKNFKVEVDTLATVIPWEVNQYEK